MGTPAVVVLALFLLEEVWMVLVPFLPHLGQVEGLPAFPAVLLCVVWRCSRRKGEGEEEEEGLGHGWQSLCEKRRRRSAGASRP